MLEGQDHEEDQKITTALLSAARELQSRRALPAQESEPGFQEGTTLADAYGEGHADGYEAAFRANAVPPAQGEVEMPDIAGHADIALQDAMYEHDDNGEKVWLYDPAKFLASMRGNGYVITRAALSPPSG